MHTKFLSTAPAVATVARAIGQCDFHTTMSHYSTGDSQGPWVITVGESRWHRHLVVLNVSDDGTCADLGLLDAEQSHRRITDINISAIERTLTLQELVADSYLGVKKLLAPEFAAA
mgnify:CR=1 FL=1